MTTSKLAISAYDHQYAARLRAELVARADEERRTKGWSTDYVLDAYATTADAPACALTELRHESPMVSARCRCGWGWAQGGTLEDGYREYSEHRQAADYRRAHVLAVRPLWAVVDLRLGRIDSLHTSEPEAVAAHNARVAEIRDRPAYMGPQDPAAQVAVRRVPPTSAVGHLV